jgi:hypothetical protein
MNQIKTFLSCLTACAAIIFSGCTKVDPTSYRASAAVNFTGQSLEYSFITNPEDEYVQGVPVRIIGDTASYDRYFKVVVVKDTSTTAVEGQYQVLGGVVKKGQFTGTLSVKLYNNPLLVNSRIGLKLKLADTTDFKAGNTESSQFVIRWTDKIVIPTWTYYRAVFSTASSTAVYRLIVQTTGLTTFTATQYSAMGAAGAQAAGTVFGDYVKQWNKDHPSNHLKHDDGTQAGQDIVPVYYSRAKFD